MIEKHIVVDCYIRVSTENQLENYSIEEQTERLKAYCKAKGWTIHKFHTDGGYSGGSTDRPALKELLKDVHNKAIDLVVVYKLDRLSRSQKDTLTLIEDEFIANGVDFVSMNENFDTSTPFGKAMIGILSVFAQLEKDQITERFTMGRIGRSKAGYYHGGSTAPTGYRYIDGKLEIDAYKAAQIREIFDRFLSGQSVNAIRVEMNNQYGGWTGHSHILYILRNSVYIGKVKFKGVEYEGVHTPIISEEVFFRAQELLKSANRESAKTTAQKTPFRAAYLLSSLIYCANCGAKYSGNHGCYRCYSRSKSSRRFIKDPSCKNTNWPVQELDNLVIHEMHQLKYTSDYFGRLFENSEPEKKVDRKAITKQVRYIDSQIVRVLDLYQLGTVPMEEIKKRIEKLQQEKVGLEAQLHEKQLNKEDSRQRFVLTLNRLEHVFTEGSLEEQRLFISSLIECITIDGERVNIKWRI